MGIKRFSRACSSMVVLLMVACSPPGPEQPSARVRDATLVGHWSADRAIAAFLGVPFAAPPVGPQRWREPAPLMLSGTIDAGNFKPACMQGPHMVNWYRDLVARFGGDPDVFPVPEFSEDCLYLNVWTPRLDPDAALPVMVWIHGGSHRGGWAFEPNYVGEELARNGVVVVSIPYRLDVFGFFTHPELDVSNFGLLDQVAALRWVQDHIGNFGGDPANITVFGESAGASSIGYLLASPLSRGLFQRVIHQSAGYQLINTHTRDQFLPQGLELERRVLAEQGGSGLAELRGVSAGDLLAAAAEVYADDWPNVVVDGHTLPISVRAALDQQRLQAVDLMIGSNADEWRMYLDPDTVEADIATRLQGYETTAEAAIRQALADSPTALTRLDRLTTAQRFVCPSLDLAGHAAAMGRNVHFYYFTRIRPGAGGRDVGAYHGAELPYVFDTHDAWLPTEPIDRELGRLMGRYWSNFARSGDPNMAGAPDWPRFDAVAGDTLAIGDTISVIEHPERRLCEALKLAATSTTARNPE